MRKNKMQIQWNEDSNDIKFEEKWAIKEKNEKAGI